MQSEPNRSQITKTTRITASTTNTTSTNPSIPIRSPTPPLDSSIEDIDELCIDHDLDVLEEDDDDDDDIPCAPRKHFLDYDSIPPPGFEDEVDDCSSTIAVRGGTIDDFEHNNQYRREQHMLYPNESRKVDKKYETDGEISDFEMMNSNSLKARRNQKQQQFMESTSSSTTVNLNTVASTSSGVGIENHQHHSQQLFVRNTGTRKKKHFLDENPIPPPDYQINNYHHSQTTIIDREHRSLDRNYERVAKDYIDVRYERKHSLDRGDQHQQQQQQQQQHHHQQRHQQKKIKEPSFAMSRFLENQQIMPPPPVYRGTWPADRPNDTQYSPAIATATAISMSMGAAATGGGNSSFGNMQLPLPTGSGEFKNLGPIGPKVECVYSLLSMLGCNNQSEMAIKFLELSKTTDTCAALRHSRCIPLIVQMIHSDADEQTRKNARIALYNVVNCHPDDKAGRREAKVLRHIEQIMDYCESLKTIISQGDTVADDTDRHPSQAIFSLMKTSFDEEHRHAMCQLGALQAIANMVFYDHAVHGSNSIDDRCISLRRYAGMALTNLTFGDGNNKALLCTNKDFMKSLVAQLESKADDLLQVTASVLRNLSWRADNTMKEVLNQIGTVTALTHAVMRNQNENTIKSLLSALWNLSAHCSTNKAEFCAVNGALAFLVDMLVYEGPSKTLTIIENAGGILRNVSSHIAVKESYRAILRQRNCLGILLQQLLSESLTIVSNACGTLWNLSARCPEDQKFLLDNKAVPMLSLLISSKHKMISNGSSAALKNLLNFRPRGNHSSLDTIAKSMKLKELPSLNARKQKALEQDLDQNLSETCENIEITTPPKEHKTIDDYLDRQYQQQQQQHVVTNSVSNNSRLSKSANKGDQNNKSITNSMNNLVESSSSTVKSVLPKPAPRISILKTEQQQTSSSAAVASSSSSTPPPPTQTSQNSTDQKTSTTYQETDLDQITDFSLRYGENQNEESESEDVKPTATSSSSSRRGTGNTDAFGNEILLVLEDSVKCYETEGTPYVISNAASVSDLRAAISSTKPTTESTTEIKNKMIKSGHLTVESSGINTPEKTTNYCEEGTPGYSVYDSYSSLDENLDELASGGIGDRCDGDNANRIKLQPTVGEISVPNKNVNEQNSMTQTNNTSNIDTNIEPASATGSSINPKAVTFETPMMFSRQSSLESLSSIEPALGDDRSSIVSDFSRLASGIMSPSEIPDSPSQMMPPLSPRRQTSGDGGGSTKVSLFPHTPPVVYQQIIDGGVGGQSTTITSSASRLRSVFEDGFNTFDVENTPAQFSCATSLSNLSLDDEPKIATDSLTKEMRLMTHPSEEQEDQMIVAQQQQQQQPPNCQSNNEELIEEMVGNVNITEPPVLSSDDSDENDDDNQLLANCINIGMNSGSANLRNVTSSSMNINNRIVTGVENDDQQPQQPAATVAAASSSSSLAVKSTTSQLTGNQTKILDDSTSGSDDAAGNDSLFEQCIRDGIQRSTGPKPKNKTQSSQINYVPPATKLTANNYHAGVLRTQNQHDDSLSSISMDSEDDGLLLSQAIAAGSQGLIKTKSNTKLPNQRQSQETRISSSNAKNKYPTMDDDQFRSTEPNFLDSLSSIDSTDSNDTHHGSLLEECIQSGMNKMVQNKPITKPRSNVAAGTTTTTVPVAEKSNVKPSILPVGALSTSSPKKRSQLPTFRSPSQHERDRQKERERKDEALLMECIQTGMTKSQQQQQQQQQQHITASRIETQIKPPTRHTRQVLAPTDYTQRIANIHINNNLNDKTTSMSKNEQTTSVAVSETTTTITTMSSAPFIAPGVEMNFPVDGTRELSDEQCQQQQQQQLNHHQQQHYQTQQQMNKIGYNNVGSTSSTKTKNIVQQQPVALQISFGSCNGGNGGGGLECSNEYPAMKLSNMDFSPDTTTTTTTSSLRDDEQSNNEMEMEMSNEFLMEDIIDDVDDDDSSVNTYKIDKHKDPDLMLKSVDRLTKELVSTAEYLRTNNTSSSSASILLDTDLAETTAYEKKSSSNSNNTWNDETCPNDVSFPSISMTAPMITSMNDEDDDATLSDIYQNKQQQSKSYHYDEETPTNENRNFVVSGSQPESLDTITTTTTTTASNSKTLQNDELSLSYTTAAATAATTTTSPPALTNSNQINFQVGGEVKPQTFRDHNPNNFLSSGPFSFDTSSAMTNSTIIALEANKLVTELLNMQTMADSSTSLDLDHIRPPSGMDTVSGYYENGNGHGGNGSSGGGGIGNGIGTAPMYSPQLNRSRKKSLPLGLMARRALSQAAPTTGSLESVNSSYNLDNIKPPSIMDELLDSMISVASITSEIVDNNHQPLSLNETQVPSVYDTALSEIEDDTTTLRSCYDLPSDPTTPIQSDFSSAESTPKKIRGGIKRALTPKQKRQIVKDRYRTYTIAADMMLNDSIEEFRNCDETVIGDGGVMIKNNDRNRMEMDSSIERTDGDGADFIVSEEMIQIEIIEDNVKRISPRQRRNEDRSRFQTQILDVAAMNLLNDDKPLQRIQITTSTTTTASAFSSQDEETDDDHHLSSFTIPLITNNTITSNYLLQHQQQQQQHHHHHHHHLQHQQSSSSSSSFNNKLLTDTSSGSNSLDDDADMASIRALTDRFKYIREPVIPLQINANSATDAFNKSKTTAAAALAKLLSNNRTSTNELNSLDFEQNSETESCNQNQCTEEDDDDDNDIHNGCSGDGGGLGGGVGDCDDETYTIAPVAKLVKPKIVKPSEQRRMVTGCESDTYFTECNGNNPILSSPESKVIRGRKKPSYVSPYRRTTTTTSSTVTAPITSRPISAQSSNNTVAINNKKNLPIASPMANTTSSPPKPNDNTKKSTIAKLMPKNQTIVAKTHVLINKTNLANKMNNLRSKTTTTTSPAPTTTTTTTTPTTTTTTGKTFLNKTTNKNNGAIRSNTVLVKKGGSSSGTLQTPQMPERQGTFVKDEPSNIDVPVVTSAPASPARCSTKLPSKLPANSNAVTPTSPAKTSNFISKLKNPLQRSTSIGSAKNNINTPSQQSSTRPTTTTAASGSDLQNKRRTAGGGGGTFYRSPSTPTVPQRSNSNTSIKSNTPTSSQPPSRSNSNLSSTPTISSSSTGKMNVTSRIAGIWKKNEPTNKSVASNGGVATSKIQSSTAVSNIGKPPTGQRLIRSSTFDNTPDKIKNGNRTTNESTPVPTATVAAKVRQINGSSSASNINNSGGGVIRRIKNGIKSTTTTNPTTDDSTKRISRLGSFINVDENSALA